MSKLVTEMYVLALMLFVINSANMADMLVPMVLLTALA